MIDIRWIIVMVFAVLLIQGLIYKKWVLEKISYSRFYNTYIAFEEEEVEMIERIYNEKLLPVPWIRIESRIDENLEFQVSSEYIIKDGQYHISLFSMHPYRRITRYHRIFCKKRGAYHLNTVTLTSGDQFGFLEISREKDIDIQLLVYPKLLSMDQIPFTSHSWYGDIAVRRWIGEDVFRVSGVREYINGDPLNKINWNATARTGSFQVHKRDYMASPRLMIYLNMDITEDMWEAVTDRDRIEKGICYAASIASYMISQGIETGFATNGYLVDQPDDIVYLPPKIGKEHMIHILDTTARLMIARKISFNIYLERYLNSMESCTDLLLITSFISDRMNEQIKRWERQGNGVEVLWLDKSDVLGREDNGSGRAETYNH